MVPVSKREFVSQALSGDLAGKVVPAGFFLHFDESCHRGQAAVDKHIEFFRTTGMDFSKIQFELPFPRVEIARPSDWSKLPALDLSFYRPQIEVVRGIVKALKPEAFVVLTLYSPYMIAGQMGGEQRLIDDLQRDPDAVMPGLRNVTESLLAFVTAAIAEDLDGFYHSTQGGESRRFSDRSIFAQHIKPTDLRVMNEIADHCEFNILHICDYHRDLYGGYDDLQPYLDYPGQVVNCHASIGASEISAMFDRPFMGGLDRKGKLAVGSRQEARAEARRALEAAPERFILAADCTVPPATPWDNLRAAIDVAHGLES